MQASFLHVFCSILHACLFDEFGGNHTPINYFGTILNITVKLILSSLVLLSLNFAYAQDGYQELDRVVASIDGEAVTASEISKRSAEQQKDLRSLLMEDVLEKEAEQRGLAVKDEDIESYIQEIKKQNNLSDQDFQQALSQKNMSFEDYKKQVKKEIMRGKVMSQIIRTKINIVDEDVKRYLEQHPDLAPPVGSYRIQLIKGEKAQLELLKQQALSRAVGLRELNAQGYEDLGYVNLEDLREDYKNVLTKYSAGEITEVIQLLDGYVLFEIVAKIEKKGDIDSALKAQIRDSIFKERYQEEVKKLFDEDLVKKHHLEVLQ